jgi:hypothetical protein
MSPAMPVRRFTPAMKSSEWLQSGYGSAAEISEHSRTNILY